jgi:hypothetical protein
MKSRNLRKDGSSIPLVFSPRLLHGMKNRGGINAALPQLIAQAVALRAQRFDSVPMIQLCMEVWPLVRVLASFHSALSGHLFGCAAVIDTPLNRTLNFFGKTFCGKFFPSYSHARPVTKRSAGFQTRQI